MQNVGEDDGSSDDEGMLCKFNFLFLLSGLVIVRVQKELCIASVSVHVIREVDFFFGFFFPLKPEPLRFCPDDKGKERI